MKSTKAGCLYGLISYKAPTSLTCQHYLMLIVTAVLSVTSAAEVLGQPIYRITAVSLPDQVTSNGQGISASGNFAAGTSNSTGVLWSEENGTVALPALPGRAFSLAQDVNDAGVVVGTGATTFFGSSPLPLIWSDTTTVSQLPLPAGESFGRAYSTNNSGQVVGSVGGGTGERAAMYTTSSGSIITQTLPNGGVLTTAYANNDAGRIVGQGLDPTSAAVTKGFYLDPGDSTATDIGALTDLGHNSAIAFAVSSNGFIAGSSSLNSGADARAFVWSETIGMTEVPLLPGTSTGGARGVNADQWVVGTMSSATAIPFLYDGISTYRLQDLLDSTGTDWDLVSGSSNGAFGIGDNGAITGRGLLNGEITGFVMTLVPEPAGLAIAGFLTIALLGQRRHKTHA